jgi:uncharacterized membrane protein
MDLINGIETKMKQVAVSKSVFLYIVLVLKVHIIGFEARNEFIPGGFLISLAANQKGGYERGHLLLKNVLAVVNNV